MFRKRAHAVGHALLRLVGYRGAIMDTFRPRGIFNDLASVFTWSSVRINAAVSAHMSRRAMATMWRTRPI